MEHLREVHPPVEDYLEAQQGDNKLPQGENNERPGSVTDPKLQELLDQAKFGDVLTITSRNGEHRANVSGPVLSDQTYSPCVGIDLLDGDPYIVRNEAGIVWAPVAYAALCRNGVIVAIWLEESKA